MPGNGTNGATPLTLDRAKELLAPFLLANPVSKVEQIEEPERYIAVASPWGDPSFHLRILTASDALIDALNRVRLPERYTAIWHTDTNLFEVIFTASPIRYKDIPIRRFNFNFEENVYECFFGDSSPELLLIAENYKEISFSLTGFRNLDSFRDYLLAKKGIEGFENEPDAKPLSFWVKGIRWDDNLLLGLVNHLNFYMNYYDAVSPQILVHSPEMRNIRVSPQTRFPTGTFPNAIDARRIDDQLLHLLQASQRGDPIRRFLYCYQILEHACFYFIEERVRRDVHKALLAPHANVDIPALVEQLVEALSTRRMSEEQRMQALFENNIDPKLIWKEIESERNFFQNEVKFEGGYVLEPFVKPHWTLDTFTGDHGVRPLPGIFYGLRNALSHAKEQKTRASILPTIGNFQRLHSWAKLVSISAREVVLYRKIG
jgi:hypothetical protein